MGFSRPSYESIDISGAIEHLVQEYSPSGNKIGWLMIASIFIEAWDLYSISFVLVFIEKIYHPSSLMLGLVAAATQGGAVIGALAGGWLTDRIGRRAVFLGTMVMFFIFGVAQAFAPSMAALVVLRFILGIPLGTDIANGYTYIMEFMQRGKREIMGNRWQFMFAVGEVVSIAVVLLFLGMGVSHDTLWRVILGLSGLPAIILFVLRFNLPETAIWLIQRGKFHEAKVVAQKSMGTLWKCFQIRTTIFPPKLRDFLREIRKDKIAGGLRYLVGLPGLCRILSLLPSAFISQYCLSSCTYLELSKPTCSHSACTWSPWSPVGRPNYYT